MISLRNELRIALTALGWSNAYELVQLIHDPDITTATAVPELRAMVADGELVSRNNAGGRVEYALATPEALAASIRAKAPAPMPTSATPRVQQQLPLVPRARTARDDRPCGRHPTAMRAVLQCMDDATAPMTLQQLARALMPMSKNSIKKALQELRDGGRVMCRGRTSAARWSLAVQP